MANPAFNDKEIKRLLAGIKYALQTTPRLIGNESVRFFKRSFIRQGFYTTGPEMWPKRKNNADPGRAVLTKTGNLRNSIRVISASSRAIVVGTDVDYAQAHNEGLRIRKVQYVRPHKRNAHLRRVKGKTQRVPRHNVNAFSRRVDFTMPQRQFIGSSPALSRHLETQVLKHFKNSLPK